MKCIDSSFYIIIVKDGCMLVFQIEDPHRCVGQQQQVLRMLINYIKLTELIDYTVYNITHTPCTFTNVPMLLRQTARCHVQSYVTLDLPVKN